MLEVNIEKILPVTEVRDSLNRIVDEVAISDELYVLTVNGKPSAVIVGVHHLEKLTGASPEALTGNQVATPNPLPATPQPSYVPPEVAPAPAPDFDLFANTTTAPLPATPPSAPFQQPAQPVAPAAQPAQYAAPASQPVSYEIQPPVQAAAPTATPADQFVTPPNFDLPTDPQNNGTTNQI